MGRAEAVFPLSPADRGSRRSADTGAPVISLRDAALAYGDRVLWHGLRLDVRPGEFLAVLGPNGSGKTSLLRVLLGRQQLTGGSLTVLGRPPRSGSRHIGYVPQQAFQPTHTLLRARDLVRLGLDGHCWGLPLARRPIRHRVDDLLDAVGATAYADTPIGRLSGGEQQRVRIAQALATDPRILLCDEPLLSLDLQHQRTITELVEERRRSAGTAVVFVTHEINPVLGLVDRVLYLAHGRYRVGRPAEVMTSSALSELYGTQVDVVRVRGRIVVVGEPSAGTGHPHDDGVEGGESQ
ncbi:zinc/manganese transport system ATP-binding protein [Streptomyces sp. 2333.5]|uniref:metal ABC transporter ATP-binding protein n=1 Tax=unclassified Streptomyces TaxID=2593676 RepID=UPI000897AE82|nr:MULTISPECIES: ABC transporter ATP-binding protein [unclassified Streptomyces]PJJ05996.1 zinc/manganese transport system ATP-binding protein [Streptomyces sp. 2333.5]SEE88312.1 zinc/manganese transport system ATP-binding protein [Streptomyces sp. 2314.4]SEF05846.1 zinc/manganese transport system ATP-binding protein [Streptomyces sp. 2112.2]